MQNWRSNCSIPRKQLDSARCGSWNSNWRCDSLQTKVEAVKSALSIQPYCGTATVGRNPLRLMTIFARSFRAATALSLLLVVSSTVCANLLLPPQTVDAHFEVRGTGLPEEERTRVLHAAEDFKHLSAAARICAYLGAFSDGYDGLTDTQMRLSFQRAQTVADLLKAVEIRSSISDWVYTETEQAA